MFAKLPGEEPTSDQKRPLLAPPQPLLTGQVLSMAQCDLLTACLPGSEGASATDVVEIPVLLPGWQALALEDAAHDRGLTAGEMLRHLLTDFFAKPGSAMKYAGPRPTGSPIGWS
jgi:hypothetical protein